MFNKYLVTGATGFLGRAVVNQLLESKADVYALVLENDALAKEHNEEMRKIIEERKKQILENRADKSYIAEKDTFDLEKEALQRQIYQQEKVQALQRAKEKHASETNIITKSSRER